MAAESSATDDRSPPGSLVKRFLKQFYYLAIWGSYIALWDLVKDIFVRAPNTDIKNCSKRSDEVAVMTGGPRGIGYDIVKKLLELDYTVILGVRNLASSEKGIEAIRKLGITTGRVKMFKLELKSLQSVRQFASDVLSSPEGARIDILLNNAGIMNVPYEATWDNYESHFQVNYLGHFLLTNLLLDRIKDTASKKPGPCFIVNTSSHAQKGGRLDFDELETSKIYSAIKCYFDSKLCQVIHTKTLQKQFDGEGYNIKAFAVHPGEIPTDLWMDLGLLARIFRPVIKYICRTTDGAADTVLYPILSPEASSLCGGQYFESGKVHSPNRLVHDEDTQKRLWDRSLELTGPERIPKLA